MRRRITALIVFMLLPAGFSLATEPLHERIDRLVEADQVTPLAPAAGDADFLRRVDLDLIGRVPSVAEAQTFLADTAATKREALVDRLLAAPEFARHMSDVFDIALMERRPDKLIPTPEWRKFLFESFLANKPFDQLAREILGADGADPKLRPAAKFYLDRDGETNLLTRDVARMFFGRDVQCSQCHDHPLIDDYLQADYYGLFAFLNRSFIFTGADNKAVFAERAEGDVAYQSVFDPTQKGKTGPKLFDSEPIQEPTFAKGDEYTVKPADKVRPIPQFSRRAQLAAEATNGHNRAFNRNIANRLWAIVMGRGLVDPVDLHHSGNPPANPALLDMLADELAAIKFDTKAFVRELVLTRTYARAVDLPVDLRHQGAEAGPALAKTDEELKRLSAAVEQSQLAVDKARADYTAARKAAAPLVDELAKAQSAATEAKKSADAARAALASARADLAAKQQVSALLAEAAAKTQAVVQKLPADKELNDAAGKFKARADSVAAEVVALGKTVPTREAAIKPAADALAAADKTLAGVTAKHNAAQQPVRALAKSFAAAAERLRSDQFAQRQVQRRVADLKALVEFARASDAADASQVALPAAQAAIEAAKPAIAAAMAQAATQSAVLAEAQQTAAAAGANVAAAKRQSAEKKSVVDAVNEAFSKTELARQKLPDDMELAQASQKLKARLDALTNDLKPLDTNVADAVAEQTQAAAKVASAKTAADAAAAQLAAAQQKLTSAEGRGITAFEKAAKDKASVDTAAADLATRLSRRGAVAGLKPLSPEQLAWSVMQVVGQVEQQARREAEWGKKNPSDPAKPAPDAVAKAQAIEQAVYDKLGGNVGPFVSLFAAAPGQPQQDFTPPSIKPYSSPTAARFAVGLPPAAAISPSGWRSSTTRRRSRMNCSSPYSLGIRPTWKSRMSRSIWPLERKTARRRFKTSCGACCARRSFASITNGAAGRRHTGGISHGMLIRLSLTGTSDRPPPILGKHGRRRGALVGGLGVLVRPSVAEQLAKNQKRILIFYMAGGLSQLESWDPKPGTDTGGPFPRDPDLGARRAHLRAVAEHRQADAPPDDRPRREHQGRRSRQGRLPDAHRPPRRSPAADYPHLGAVAAKALTPEIRSAAGPHPHHAGRRRRTRRTMRPTSARSTPASCWATAHAAGQHRPRRARSTPQRDQQRNEFRRQLERPVPAAAAARPRPTPTPTATSRRCS